MRKDLRRSGHSVNYALSFSDILSALILLLILIIAITAANLEEQRNKLREAEEAVQKILGVREEVIDILIEEFGDEIDIDENTGDIRFDSQVLFGFNESKLTTQGKTILADFFPRYYEALQDSRIKDNIALIVFEGHTDSSGDFLYNLKLSQARAYSTAEYCLGVEGKLLSKEEKALLEKKVTANGRSFGDLKASDKESRRVEIKFRLKEEESINQLNEYINNIMNGNGM